MYISKRQKPLPFIPSLAIACMAVCIAFALSAGLLIIQDKSPLLALQTLFAGIFSSSYLSYAILIKSIPIALCSLAVAVAFTMQIWNIGAEGQFALGAMGATWVVLTFPNFPPIIMMPAICFAAMLFGGAWAFIPALLRVSCGLNEIISTLMMNYIGILTLQYFVYGPWKSPSAMGFPMTDVFPESAIFAPFWPEVFGHVHSGIFLVLLVAIVLAWFLQKTLLGFEIRIAGVSPRAAQYAHMPYNLLFIGVLVASGAIAGLTGGIEVSATFSRLQPNIVTGYGYTAIVVAWLSGLRISSILFFSIFLAALRVGVENLQLEMGVPAAFSGILEGLILLCVIAGTFFTNYTINTRSNTSNG